MNERLGFLTGLKLLFAFFAGALFILMIQHHSPSSTPRVLGAVEPVYFTGLDLALLARVDTGATTSSLSAQDIELSLQNGEEWVSFVLVHPSLQQSLSLSAPLVRYAQIRQANQTAPIVRAVVVLPVIIQDESVEMEFTLTDRSHLHYPVLLGRNLLQQGWLVDVSR